MGRKTTIPRRQERETAFPEVHSRVQWATERASYNGSIEASQASDVGSIPIARSN